MLQLITEQGIEPDVVLYLEDTPDADDLKRITELLDCSIESIMRKGESLYRELGIADQTLSESELVNLVVANPILLERPIVVNGDRAVIGRPPENVLSIL